MRDKIIGVVVGVLLVSVFVFTDNPFETALCECSSQLSNIVTAPKWDLIIWWSKMTTKDDPSTQYEGM